MSSEEMRQRFDALASELQVAALSTHMRYTAERIIDETPFASC